RARRPATCRAAAVAPDPQSGRPRRGAGPAAAARRAPDRTRDGRTAGRGVGVPRLPVVPAAAHGPPGGGGIRRRPRAVAGHRAIFREAGAHRRPAELKTPPRPTRLRSRGRQASTGLARISLRAQVVSHLVKPLANFITANSNLALAA